MGLGCHDATIKALADGPRCRVPHGDRSTMAYLVCPRCGSAAHVRLAPPAALRCAACGYVGPPRPDDAAVLRVLADELSATQHQLDQLTSHQRSFLLKGRASLQQAYAVTALLLGYVALYAMNLVRAWGRHGGSLESIGGLALVGVVASLIIGLWLWRFAARIARAEAQLGATPPLATGAPPACRLCGGDLPVAGPARALVDCRFCRAQNLHIPGKLRAGAARVAADVHALRRDILATARAHRWHERFLVARVFVVACLAVVAGLVVWIETAHSLPRRLAFIDHPYPRVCVARWDVSYDMWTHVAVLRPGGAKRYVVSDGSSGYGNGYAYFAATSLIGREVEVMHDMPWSGRVVASRGHTLAVDRGGQSVAVPAHAVCMQGRHPGDEVVR